MRHLAVLVLLLTAALPGQNEPPLVTLPSPPSAQEPRPAVPEPERPTPTEPPTREAAALPAIKALVLEINQKREELRIASRKLPRNTETIKETADLAAQLERLAADLDSIVTGIDREQLDQAARSASLNDDLEELLRPILQELKSATEEPRELERLRGQVASQVRKAQLAIKAINNIKGLQAEATDATVKKELDAALTQWEAIRTGAINGQTVAQAQLDQRLRDRKSLVESASALVGGFFRNKGLNLLLAALSMALVFVGLRYTTARAIRLITPKGKRAAQPFYFRLIQVLGQAVIGSLAVVAGLMVLYAAGDWVLLGLGLLFLVGLAWTAKNTLPRMVEQVRLVLNLGSVREGERVVFEGLPWRVDRLSVYSRLSNSALSGGEIRLPLRDLVGLHSRPCQDKEAWFPCNEGDWVRLSDGVRAKVLRQTPEMVQLVKLGGSRVTYPTEDFLGLGPENISANFRLSVTFGVDYAHQAICTTEIPELMRARLEREIGAKIGEDNIINLSVEFKEAGASSLDYEVIIDLNGDVAARYDSLRRLTQRVLVDACNEHGWVIPFTQVTLHQAT